MPHCLSSTPAPPFLRPALKRPHGRLPHSHSLGRLHPAAHASRSRSGERGPHPGGLLLRQGSLLRKLLAQREVLSLRGRAGEGGANVEGGRREERRDERKGGRSDEEDMGRPGPSFHARMEVDGGSLVFRSHLQGRDARAEPGLVVGAGLGQGLDSCVGGADGLKSVPKGAKRESVFHGEKARSQRGGLERRAIRRWRAIGAPARRGTPSRQLALAGRRERGCEECGEEVTSEVAEAERRIPPP